MGVDITSAIVIKIESITKRDSSSGPSPRDPEGLSVSFFCLG